MNPLMLSALLSSFPGILSHIFGGDPQAKLRQQVQQLLSPEYQAKLQQQYYQQQLASPGFSQGQSAIAAGANATGSQLGQELGARGIGTSGTGAILNSLIPSIVGSQQAGLRTAANQTAANQTQNTIQSQIANLQNTAGPGQTRQLFAGGLEAFLPYLQNFLTKQKAGGMGGGNSMGGGDLMAMLQRSLAGANAGV